MTRRFPEPGDLITLEAESEFIDDFDFMHQQKKDYVKVTADNDNWMQNVFDFIPGMSWHVEPGCYATVIEYGKLPGVTLSVVKVFLSVVTLTDYHEYDEYSFSPGFYWTSIENIGQIVDPDDIDLTNL